MLPAQDARPAPGFVALLRFRSSDVPVLMAHLRESVALLSAQHGFVNAHMARAIDEPGLIVLHLGWDTVGSYRRALSAYDVKVQVVPVISQALDEADGIRGPALPRCASRRRCARCARC